MDKYFWNHRKRRISASQVSLCSLDLIPPGSRCSFSMMVKWANDVKCSLMMGMLINDGEMRVWSYTHFTMDEHFTIINKYFTTINKYFSIINDYFTIITSISPSLTNISHSLTSISPSVKSISPSLTSTLPSWAWSKPSFANLTIVEKLHRLPKGTKSNTFLYPSP